MNALALLTLLASDPLVLWHSYTRNERDALEAAVAAYPEKVEVSFVPFSALADKLTAAIPHGHGPDLFIFAHDRLGGWAEGRLVEPIELFVDEPLLDQHVTPCVFALAYGESLYGLPLAFKSLALFHRLDKVENPPTTFEEMVTFAKKYTVKEKGHYGLVYPNGDLFFHSPFIFSLGGQLYAPSDPKRPKLANIGPSLKLARRLSIEDQIIPDDPSPPMASSMFSEGRTAMVISGPWFTSEIDPGVTYGIAPIPAAPGGKPSSGFSTCEGLMMSRFSKNKRAAFAFMKYLTTDMGAAVLRMKQGGQTVTLSKAWDEALPAMSERERKNFEAFRTAFSTSVTTPSHPSMNAVWTPLNAALYKSIHRGMSPSEAEAEAQSRIDKALDLGN